MAKPLRYFLTEAITRADLDRFRKDAGAFTKNVLRIKSGQELARVAEAARIWHDYLDTFVYKRLMDAENLNTDKEHYTSRDLRKSMWDLRHEIVSLFTMDGRGFHYLPGKQYVYNTQTAYEWDQRYSAFDKVRKSTYAKLGRLVRDAFKDLDAFWEFKTAGSGENPSIPERNVETRLVIDGVKVVVVSDETKPETTKFRVKGDYSHTPEDRGFAALRQAIKLIRHKGLGSVLTDVTFRLHPRMGEGVLNGARIGASGTYEEFGKIVNIFVGGTEPHTFIHELGHHVYRTRLAPAQTKAWVDYVQRGQVRFTDDEIAMIREAAKRAFERYTENTRFAYAIDEFWEEKVPQFLNDNIFLAKSPALLAKYKHFMSMTFGHQGRSRHITPIFHRIWDAALKRDVDVPDAFNKGWAHAATEFQKPFLAHAPTAYSNSNAEEAFCETFTFWVMGKPLGTFHEAMFTSITSYARRG